MKEEMKNSPEETEEVNLGNAEEAANEQAQEKACGSEQDPDLNDLPNQYSEALEKAEEERKAMAERLQRLAAEFDNYKKRTAKEKERLYQAAVCDTVSSLLPVVDNFGRALQAIDTEDDQSFREGIAMVAKQLDNTLEGLGVEKIKALGCDFDPNIHNAVMHVEDETVGENTIVEELQTGYMHKDQVIRYSMVKVAN